MTCWIRLRQEDPVAFLLAILPWKWNEGGGLRKLVPCLRLVHIPCCLTNPTALTAGHPTPHPPLGASDALLPPARGRAHSCVYGWQCLHWAPLVSAFMGGLLLTNACHICTTSRGGHVHPWPFIGFRDGKSDVPHLVWLSYSQTREDLYPEVLLSP